MDLTGVHKNLVFANRNDNIYPILMEVTAFAEKYLPPHAHRLVPAVKLIIIELVTNAIKHSGEKMVYFDLSIQNDHFLIIRSDAGKPLVLQTEDGVRLQWPFGNAIAVKNKLYSDGLNGLFAEVIDSRSVRFISEEFITAYSGVLNILEHYGLLIITKSADSFIYTFDDHRAQNIFEVKLVFAPQ